MSTLKNAAAFVLLLAAPFCSPCLAQEAPKKFIVYEFIPYHAHDVGGAVSGVPSLTQYLDSLDLHAIKVIYLPRFMSDGHPDDKKIEDIARSAIEAPGIPVSFDTEFGNRSRPETVIPGVSEILRIYHRYNTVTPVGVYGTAPQNTYAWKPDIARFDALNERYASIANQVDFLSPVLYNYEGGDTAAWKRAAVYNIAAAKKYHTGKSIIPYISITIRLKSSGENDQTQHGPVRMLTEGEMHTRLETLYELGADGCIVWASSNDRTLDGKAPVFDRNSGWGKALADFAQAHR